MIPSGNGGGIGFVIHDTDKTPLGKSGHGYGYHGIDRSAAVVFYSTKRNSFITFCANSKKLKTNKLPTALKLSSSKKFTVKITYRSGNLTLTLTDKSNQTLSLTQLCLA